MVSFDKEDLDALGKRALGPSWRQVIAYKLKRKNKTVTNWFCRSEMPENHLREINRLLREYEEVGK